MHDALQLIHEQLPPWSNPGDGLRLFKPGQDTSKFVGNDRRQSAYADYVRALHLLASDEVR